MLSWVYIGFAICFMLGRLYEIEKREDARRRAAEHKRRAEWFRAR